MRLLPSEPTGTPNSAAAGAVLVVDDDKDMCWALELGLKLAGYAALSAGSAEAALAALARQRFDFAFVDARLPDMDGLQLAAELRQKRPDMTVILISGYYFSDDRRISAALSSGSIHGFLAKPFRIDAAIEATGVRREGNPLPIVPAKLPAPQGSVSHPGAVSGVQIVEDAGFCFFDSSAAERHGSCP